MIILATNHTIIHTILPALTTLLLLLLPTSPSRACVYVCMSALDVCACARARARPRAWSVLEGLMASDSLQLEVQINIRHEVKCSFIEVKPHQLMCCRVLVADCALVHAGGDLSGQG